jgi:hypothetical protein
MGLDTRAFKRADKEWRKRWVERINEAGERPAFFGLGIETLEQPVTLDDAPLFHQDELDQLPWPGGLIGGMLSGCGDGPSFRGKAYASYVQEAIGLDLYAICHAYLEGEDLQVAAASLRACVEDDALDELAPLKEREALARWFEVCAEHDLVVGGDY